jgi:hypothetical protein
MHYIIIRAVGRHDAALYKNPSGHTISAADPAAAAAYLLQMLPAAPSSREPGWGPAWPW